ncbi:hypothetical protein CGGC5_v013090 [Colletotrichum fructicola Nara gc5]|uniref:Glucose receptor Git3-like N-terminal domain-containing protein n=1 Tax=Colletotrichum fructicola (strain Nara gc5) TaxID=1213859 RepID=A0A7J6INJ5_COLFN|nr:hypothetical protein CFRS1_v016027 [Colletotrichum fructicola]KAF4478112.1 hypothetical protein CGGC5_v013090 [Colletotrichum fructicola Nara gc5]
MTFNVLVASLTLMGSSLSFLTTFGALISIGLQRTRRRSLRHILILNLMVAEFINSAKNTVSGIIYIKDQGLQRGTACVLNSVIGQLSVQASDFSILAIAIATLLVVKQKTSMAEGTFRERISICFCVWLVPIATSVAAAGIGVVGPVSGNWCWITWDRPDLRFALTYVWRLWIMFATVFIYAYVWWYLGRRLRPAAMAPDSLGWTGGSTSTASLLAARQTTTNRLGVDWPRPQTAATGGRHPPRTRQPLTYNLPPLPTDATAFHVTRCLIKDSNSRSMPSRCNSRSWGDDCPADCRSSSRRDVGTGNEVVLPNITAAATAHHSIDEQSRRLERRIKRMMFLNSYPILYILLWIPGLVNRVMEACGVKLHGLCQAYIA